MNATATDTRQQIGARTVSEWVRWLAVYNDPGKTGPKMTRADARLDGALEIAYLALGFRTPTEIRLIFQDAGRQFGSRPRVTPSTPATAHEARTWDAQVTEFLLTHKGTMKVTHDQATEIERGLYQLDLDASLHTDYSGRNMYGRTCLGFEVGDTHRLMYCLGRLLQSTIEDEHDPLHPIAADLDTHVAGYRTDNLGFGYIAYFPGIEVES